MYFSALFAHAEESQKKNKRSIDYVISGLGMEPKLDKLLPPRIYKIDRNTM